MPCNKTTRPVESVSQRPEWVIGPGPLEPDPVDAGVGAFGAAADEPAAQPAANASATAAAIAARLRRPGGRERRAVTTGCLSLEAPRDLRRRILVRAAGPRHTHRVSVLVDRPLDPAGVPEDEAPPSASRRRVFAIRAVVGLAIVGGIALRLYFAVGPHSSPNSDEAIVGLMAVRLLHGQLPPAFYWHQYYGGSLESVAVAPFVALFGTTSLGLRSASVIFELTTCWLTWRVARHLYRSVIAGWVGAVSLFFPLVAILYGTKELGFYPLTAALGFASVLMAVNIDEQPANVRYWLGLGLATGVGWWMSPNIAYYALPVAVWLLARGHWRHARNILVAALAFGAGAAVWIGAGFHTGFRAMLRPPLVSESTTFAHRFGFFWTHGLPFALGLRAVAGWYVGAGFGITLYVVVLVAFAWALARTKSRVALDVFILAASPFVFAAFVGNFQLGRYIYFVASMMPFVIGRILAVRAGRVVVAVLLTVATYGFVNAYGTFVGGTPGSTLPLARAIAAAGYHTATGSYWIDFKMSYQSDELVIAAPTRGMTGDRYPPYAKKVFNSRPAYLFGSVANCNAKNPRILKRALDRLHIGYKVIVRGSYCAVLPAERFQESTGP
jgi:Dolichyl-phosphate-mannose-protein mannosyltransferase